MIRHLLVSDTGEGLRQGLALVYERLSSFGLVVNAQKSDPIAFAGLLSHQCFVCERQDGRDSQTLMCEMCDRAFHVSCAGLQAVPDGEWWCEGCGGEAARDREVLGCVRERVVGRVCLLGTVGSISGYASDLCCLWRLPLGWLGPISGYAVDLCCVWRLPLGV